MATVDGGDTNEPVTPIESWSARWFCGYRVRVEAQVLCQALGQPYREYMRHTRRFIPFVL
jgi:protein-S-isoprenylcysteine O-methyltransferase Ste14